MSSNVSPQDLSDHAERIREIASAMAVLVNEAVEIADQLDDQNAIHYILAPLQIHSGADHDWLTCDQSLLTWADELEARAAALDYDLS